MNRYLTALAVAAVLATGTIAAGPKYNSVTYKNICMHPVMLEQVGQIKTRPSDGTGNSRWSIGCETLDRDYSDFENYKEYLGELGFGYARLQSGWQKTEKEKGIYDFGWLDKIVDGVVEQGLKPWISLSYGNTLYSNGGIDLNAKIFTDETTMKAWERYVEATVKHFKGRVAGWEIWNEPQQEHEYASLVIHTSDVIRRYDKSTPILAGAITGTQLGNLKIVKTLMDDLKSAGKTDAFDYFTFHPYYPNPDWATGNIKALAELLHSYNPKIKIMQGETGCPSQLEYGHALKNLEWSEYSQVKWDLRRMACDFALDIPSNIFTFVDLQYKNFMLQSFGMLRMNLNNEVMYKRPAFYGVRNMARLLTESVKAVDLGFQAYSDKEISVVGIADKDGKTIGAMVWFSGEKPGDSLEKEPVNITIKGLVLNNAVYVEPVTGCVYSLKTVCPSGAKSDGQIRFANLPLWDSPVFIMEKDALDM